MQTAQSLINQSTSSVAGRQKFAAIKISGRWVTVTAAGVISALLGQSMFAQQSPRDVVAPTVFQAAGPTTASIQGTIDAYRAALGGLLNGNNPGPLVSGRREINWDGGNPNITATTDPVTPFNTFLNTRGSQFTTPGTGLSQAAPSGLAALFNNPTYANIFAAFSPSRLFTPVGSNITEGLFFIPGTNGGMPAEVSGFGAIFTDVDRQESSDTGRHHRNQGGTTSIEYFDQDGKLLFSSNVPASPGDAHFSFFGVVFDDARIARIQITTGDTVPGRNDDRNHDVVMMDDFIYGEPQLIH